MLPIISKFQWQHRRSVKFYNLSNFYLNRKLYSIKIFVCFLIFFFKDIQAPSTSSRAKKTPKLPAKKTPSTISKKKKIKRPHVEIEYEVETEQPSRQRLHKWGNFYRITFTRLLCDSLVLKIGINCWTKLLYLLSEDIDIRLLWA